MYCGSLGYLPVIEFVIDLFCKLKEISAYNGKLLLALGGYGKLGEFNGVIKRIDDSIYGKDIILKTNVPHNELIKIYLGAELLIVPMRNYIRDIAGFHHKIGEYCAARKPIISTNYGELSYYFNDGISAILADEYTIDSYVDKLKTVLPHKDKLKMIAEGGFQVGSEKLNYLNNGTILREFILELRQKM